jgi:hypothetical protein
LAAFGNQGIEQRDEIETLGDVPQGGDVAAGSDLGFERLRGNMSLLGGGDEVLEFAEVDLADDLGFAVNALAIAGIVIGVTVDLLGGEAWHI